MKNIFLGDRHQPEIFKQQPCKDCQHRGNNNKCWSCISPAIYYKNFEAKTMKIETEQGKDGVA